MRYRATFIAGFAAGFVAGARAGRERYEQMKKLGRKAAESPAVRRATQVAGEKAVELSKVAMDTAATRMPRLAETAKSGASRVRGQLDRIPGRHSAGPGAGTGAGTGADSEHATVNGTRPVN